MSPESEDPECTLTYLICPTVQKFFYSFQKRRPRFKFQVKQVLGGDLSGKFQPNSFLKSRFLVADFTVFPSEEALRISRLKTSALQTVVRWFIVKNDCHVLKIS